MNGAEAQHSMGVAFIGVRRLAAACMWPVSPSSTSSTLHIACSSAPPPRVCWCEGTRSRVSWRQWRQRRQGPMHGARRTYPTCTNFHRPAGGFVTLLTCVAPLALPLETAAPSPSDGASTGLRFISGVASEIPSHQQKLGRASVAATQSRMRLSSESFNWLRVRSVL